MSIASALPISALFALSAVNSPNSDLRTDEPLNFFNRKERRERKATSLAHFVLSAVS